MLCIRFCDFISINLLKGSASHISMTSGSPVVQIYLIQE